MPEKRNRSGSGSNPQTPVDLTISSPIARTTIPPTTSRELQPRSQSRTRSNNSKSKSKTKAAAATSTRRTRSHSVLSLSLSEPRLQTDVGEASGSASGSGSASASLSRQSPDDVGSLVTDSTLAEVRDTATERQLVEAGTSSGDIGFSSRGEAGSSSRSRKRRRVGSSGSAGDNGTYEIVEASGDRDRERHREYSHPPIACLTAAPPSTTSPNAEMARIRELINRRGAQTATTLSPTSPSRKPAPSSLSMSSYPTFTSGEDPFVSDSIPAPLPSTSASTSTSTSSQPISSASSITITPAPSATAAPLSTYTCPICFSPPTNTTLTPCGHVCCGVCLFTAVKATLQRGALMAGGGAEEGNFPRCPVCRARIPGWNGRGGGVIGLKARTIFSL